MANRIGQLRREYGLNQKELGQKLGVGQTTVSAWETGKNEPDSKSMNNMATMFHASIGYLMGFDAENGMHGLSYEAWQAYQAEIIRKKEQEECRRDYEQENDHSDLTDEEKLEIILSEAADKFSDGSHDDFPELQRLRLYFEYLNEDQRRRVVSVVEKMFPHAMYQMYTEEKAHK